MRANCPSNLKPASLLFFFLYLWEKKAKLSLCNREKTDKGLKVVKGGQRAEINFGGGGESQKR
jgi:hypothetical protein